MCHAACRHHRDREAFLNDGQRPCAGNYAPAAAYLGLLRPNLEAVPAARAVARPAAAAEGHDAAARSNAAFDAERIAGVIARVVAGVAGGVSRCGEAYSKHHEGGVRKSRAAVAQNLCVHVSGARTETRAAQALCRAPGQRAPSSGMRLRHESQTPRVRHRESDTKGPRPCSIQRPRARCRWASCARSNWCAKQKQTACTVKPGAGRHIP